MFELTTHAPEKENQLEDQQKQIFSTCPNCESEELDQPKIVRDSPIVRCRDCRFHFDQRIPSDAELNEFYSRYNYDGRRPCLPPTRQSYLRLLRQFENYRNTNRVLDVGCGQGDFLVTARDQGWDVFGTEHSESAVELCVAEGLDVKHGKLSEDFFDGESFDIITSFEVFEHIYDGAAELRKFIHYLRPGGLIYITTPNYDALLRHMEGNGFLMVSWPEHISFYNVDSMTYLARSSGLRVVKVETTGLAPGRFKASLSRRNKVPEGGTSDKPVQNWRAETKALQASIQKRPTLRFAKKAVNAALNATRLGDALKVWLEKPTSR